MQVGYEIKHIEGKGNGLIATQFIPKGASVWKYFPENIHVLKNEQDFEEFTKDKTIEQIKEILIHAYGWEDALQFLTDDGKYFNHSHEPNVEIDPNDYQSNVASRDIQIGEEIVDDYSTYQELEWVKKLAEKYQVEDCNSFAKQFNQQKKEEQQNEKK